MLELDRGAVAKMAGVSLDAGVAKAGGDPVSEDGVPRLLAVFPELQVL